MTHSKSLGPPPGLVALLSVPWLVGLLFWGWHVLAWQEQQRWPAVQARVIEVEVAYAAFTTTDECAASNPFEVIVSYEYEVEGTRYAGKRFNYDQQGEYRCDRGDADAQADHYRKAQTVTAYYDPDTPSNAVLQRPDSVAVYLAAPLFLLTGIALGAYFLRQRRRHRAADDSVLVSAL